MISSISSFTRGTVGELIRQAGVQIIALERELLSVYVTIKVGSIVRYPSFAARVPEQAAGHSVSPRHFQVVQCISSQVVIANIPARFMDAALSNLAHLTLYTASSSGLRLCLTTLLHALA